MTEGIFGFAQLLQTINDPKRGRFVQTVEGF